MKVKITQRSVYHKIAEIEIEIPDLIDDETEVQQYLIDNEYLFVDKIDKKINNAHLNFGFGLDNDAGLDEKDNESEWRYDIVGQNYGGHL
tara:strand:- start:2422 stop:2691 length:270 start_codon:yes stop_codon:yes gene_type:complete